MPIVCRECGYGLFFIDMTDNGLKFRCVECDEEYTVIELPTLQKR